VPADSVRLNRNEKREALGVKGNDANRQITIKGIVTPADWDDNGNIIAVVVSTPLEEEYLVEGGDLRAELLRLVGAEVIVKGTPGTDRHRCKTIIVEHYGLLEHETEDEEEFKYQEEQW